MEDDDAVEENVAAGSQPNSSIPTEISTNDAIGDIVNNTRPSQNK